MQIVLEVTSGPHAGKKFQLEPGQVVRVGRTDKSDFATQDTYMSGLHFAVECGDESCRLHDLNSRNGTLLNDQSVQGSAVLRDGDRIFAGQTNFLARVQTTAPAPRMTRTTSAQQQPDTVTDMTPVELPPDSVRFDDEEPAHAGGQFAPPPGQPAPPAARLVSPPAVSGEVQPQPSQLQPQSSEPLLPPVVKTDYGTVPFKGAAFRGGGGGGSGGGALPGTPAPDAQERRVLESPATPKGRLLQILREQREPVLALLDALNEPRLLELLHDSQEEYATLYEGGQHAAEKIPYIVSLPGGSRLLETFVQHGWGKNWGVFLTTPASLSELRDYFRQNLMVKAGDREFFFRFYEPRFLRETLRAISYVEASRFFGPVTRYFVEAEKPEILLQFTKGRQEIELKERLLLLPGT